MKPAQGWCVVSVVSCLFVDLRACSAHGAMLGSGRAPLTQRIPALRAQAFSAGPRNCIGKALARSEALSIAAPLLRRFHLELADTADQLAEPDDTHMITRKPTNGIRFRVTRRP